MKMNRITAFFIALTICMSVLCGYAEQNGDVTSQVNEAASVSETSAELYYTGGVVWRTVPRDGGSTLIELAYTLTDMPYIVLGETYSWDVYVSGGTQPYTLNARLAWQTLDKDPFADSWSVLTSFEVADNEAAYTFTKEGRYFWRFTVADSNGQTLTFETRIYEGYTGEDESDDTTTVGKVNRLIDELITDDMSDYSRALVLHDWLIYNANYDYTYTHYDASGVLLYGTGVCDSYARAYLMLCTAAGLECVYVSGTAGSDEDPANWGNHGWNLVKLGGNWYHVDCTWDDPNEGGSEQHTYFCVDDETMAKDHRWNRADDVFASGGMIVPDAEGGEYEASDDGGRDYDFTFTSMDEFEANMNALVQAGEHRASTVGLYTGSGTTSEVWSEFSDWTMPYAQTLANQGLVTSVGSSRVNHYYTLRLGWVDPDDYVRIDETSVRLSAGESSVITPAQTYPEDTLVGTWSSSNTDIAAVSASYDSENGYRVTITGVREGTATVTVTTEDGLSDSLTVTVLPPHRPEFDFALSASADGSVTLSWNSIPGVTGYKVMRTFNGATSVLTSTTDCSATFTGAELPGNVCQTLYVLAERVVAGETAVSYTSDEIEYGELSFSYTATLPADTTTIDTEAFLNNASLTAVRINDGVTSIGSRAFAGCSSMYVVRIPASVTSIGSGAFDGSALAYAEVVEGSVADGWLQTNYPDVELIYD